MLKVSSFRQKPGYCGPASLKMVLSYFGVEKGEMSLVRLSKCSKDKGATSENLLKAAKKLGFKGFIKDYSDFKDIKRFLKKKIPVIVDWFSIEEGHYSVVVRVDGKKIYLQDPELGRLKVMNLKEFKTVWFDFPGPFLKSRKDLIIRRMLVIYK
jgi:ABC-type bacteriocin/lantibiotic exporter with double-glycine peptidase domain